jgi:hypothetical protein
MKRPQIRVDEEPDEVPGPAHQRVSGPKAADHSEPMVLPQQAAKLCFVARKRSSRTVAPFVAEVDSLC